MQQQKLVRFLKKLETLYRFCGLGGVIKFLDWRFISRARKDYIISFKVANRKYSVLTYDLNTIVEMFSIYFDACLKLGLIEAHVILDVGGFLGETPVFFAALYPRSVIHVYEPSPTAFRYLVANISRNSLQKRVHAYNLALSDSDGELEFIDTGGAGASLAEFNFANLSKRVKVRAISFEKVLKNFNRIDLAKIDIEGAEYKIFKNANKKMLEKIKCMIIEFHRINGSWEEARRLEKKLKDSGFREKYYYKLDENAYIKAFIRK